MQVHVSRSAWLQHTHLATVVSCMPADLVWRARLEVCMLKRLAPAHSFVGGPYSPPSEHRHTFSSRVWTLALLAWRALLPGAAHRGTCFCALASGAGVVRPDLIVRECYGWCLCCPDIRVQADTAV